MQANFKKATRHLSPEDIVSTTVPPFGSFEPAGFLNEFYNRLDAHQAAQGTTVQAGFVFGGVFADLSRNIKPKDYDVYIASPDMVERLKRFIATGGMEDDFMNEGEWAEMALGFDFPITPHTDDLRLMHSDILGDYFEFNGACNAGGAYRKIDIKVGTKNPEPAEFITFVSAPIMSAAMTLGSEEPVFSYHRDCADHAMRGILCTQRPDNLDLIEKAKRKNLEIITPDALAARDAAQQKLLRSDAARDPGYELHI